MSHGSRVVGVALTVLSLLLVGLTVGPWIGRALQSPQAQAQTPLPTGWGPSATWTQQPMTGGPSLYWACVNGDLIYAIQARAWRGTDGLWPDASLAVAPGKCLYPHRAR